MKQIERMNSASNQWEPDPWDASDAEAASQFEGFEIRSAKPLIWFPIRSAKGLVFGTDAQKLINADVEYFATYDDEDMILMRLAWHGFPDPPEWRLATRPSSGRQEPWKVWGYFAKLPDPWVLSDI